MKHVYVLLFDGFADHEIALALAELNAGETHRVITCGFDNHAVRAMSGMRVLPEIACGDIDPARAAMFIVPGGDLWEHADRNRPLDPVTNLVTDMLQDFDNAGVPIAGICGATAAIARAGLLEGVNHTSNGPDYLPALVPGFRGTGFYIPDPAVSEQNIITANGTACVEFAQEILRLLEVYEEEDLPLWLALYKHGEFSRPITRKQAA